ncbi:MAG: RNHCP domain-containing protein [Zetaproteobacteria bacterium]|nr:RNHCP domain-containing protein [Pseudobdellovibrionaceae bacterium]
MKNNRSKFTKINNSFDCINCKKHVPPSERTCRNHCPFCLTSLHVDINPGDRANPCKGIMDAINYDVDGKKGLVLIFKCRDCKEITRNIASIEDPQQSDDYDRILTLNQP